MSLPILPATHTADRNAPDKLATRIVAALFAFLFIALSQPAHAAPPVPAPPSFLFGNLTARVLLTQPGTKPVLSWSIHLPASESESDYSFFIRQKMLTNPPFYWDMADLAREGEDYAAIAINPYGSTFELWAVKAGTPNPTNYLLDTTTLGPHVPPPELTIVTEDTFSGIPRTRADRPFSVRINAAYIISDPAAPESAQGVTLTHHAQPYGPTGTGASLDRTQATQVSQANITTNGLTTLPFPTTSIPGENRMKVRGEERFTIISHPDTGGNEEYPMAAHQLETQTIQIWPVADATITGIHPGKVIGNTVPPVTFQLNDLYPRSYTRAQIYKGALAPTATITGITLPDSAVSLHDSVPANRTITVSDYSSLLNDDGLYTIELLTSTPFGTDRLAHVSFTVQRTTMTVSQWRQFHFDTPSDTGDSADDNDYDHDGLPNLIEFAYGLDPKQNSAGLLPIPERTASDLAFRFTPPAGITGIRYGAEWSTTLQPNSWTPIPNTGPLPEQLFTLPTTGKPQLYLRLTAEQP